MPSVRERELARVINQSWKPLEKWVLSPSAKQALAGGVDPFTGTQRFLAWDVWLKTLEGVNDPLKAQTQLSMAAMSADIRGVGADLSFNVLDRVSERYAASQAGLLVDSISSGQKQVIQKIIRRAVAGELTVDTAARHLKGSIGLHPAWAEAVAKYGDRQFDRLIKDGLKMDVAAAKATAQQERYRKRLVGARSRNIARTEIATANNVGQYAAYGQAVEDGYAHPQSLKEWAPGPGACGICGPMSGEKVQWDQPFSNGNMMPPGHPGCRCSTNLLDPTREYRGINHTNPKGDRLTAENMATQKPATPAFSPTKAEFLPGVDPSVQLRNAAYEKDPAPRQHLTTDLMPVEYAGKPLGMEAASRGANPNWGQTEYSKNCSSCATSYEFRRRGFPVQAGPTPGRGRFDTEYVSNWWNDADGNPVESTMFWGKNEFKSWMKEQPPGARGYVMVQWNRGGGHVFNWEVDSHGILNYIDVQPNKSNPFVTYKEWSYLAKSTIRAVRMDDKIPNTRALEAIVKTQPEGTKAPPVRRRNMIG